MEANCPEQLGSAAVVMEAEDAIENLVIIWVDQGLTVQTSVGWFKGYVQQTLMSFAVPNLDFRFYQNVGLSFAKRAAGIRTFA
jgi:hypothetical protein